ncbi:MAG: PAS domain S-box protein, partial [Candidatus Delongbacteria bacterium]|nr:PAS domain S-box protein [Candidatus Delongbacteria bacterium]
MTSDRDNRLDYIQNLTKAFEEFNTSTNLLTQAYHELQERFREINFQLEEKNQALEVSLDETFRVRNYLNNILESMNSGVAAVDLNGKITIFNKAAEEITGWTARETIGNHYKDFLGVGVDHQLSLTFTILTGQNIINREKEIQTRDGRRIPVSFSTSYVTDQKGSILGAVEIFQDMTSYKKLEDEIIRKSTLAGLGEMAATVAHEIRNPLGGITGFAQLLARDLDAQDPRLRLVHKIIQGVEILNRIVSNLLAFTREFKPQFQILNLVTLLQQAEQMIRSDIEQRRLSISIALHFPEPDCEIRADRDLLVQAIYNILLNAVDAIPESQSGRIEIRLHHDEQPAASKQRWEYITKTPSSLARQILLEIRDNGKGISPQHV